MNPQTADALFRKTTLGTDHAPIVDDVPVAVLEFASESNLTKRLLADMTSLSEEADFHAVAQVAENNDNKKKEPAQT